MSPRGDDVDPRDVPWGGRFSAGPRPELLRLTSSIALDLRLLGADVAATKAHARALLDARLLDGEQVAALDAACDELAAEWRAGRLEPAPHDEDVHSLVERRLTERLGDTGARIHAGRSRNDLVATDLRLWCRSAAARSALAVADVLDVLARRAEEHRDTVMPGYTHLQRGQPVTLAFHLLAHGFALARDGARFSAAAAAADACPLGAGALAGTTLPLDPSVAAAELGFARSFDNAMDAVSDRDFACDLVYAAALCGVHLSRVAEEVVLWTSAEFGFARLPDEWSTGSSMMPQKRNPDLAELVRSRSAAGVADLTGLLALLKGLPLAYDRDLQEDKGYVFAAVDRIGASLDAVRYVLGALEFDAARLEAATRSGAPWATDVAERLVARGIPFRDAHRIVGRLVARLDADGRSLADAADDLPSIDPRLEPGDAAPGVARAGVTARRARGGPSSAAVDDQLRVIRRQSKQLRSISKNT